MEQLLSTSYLYAVQKIPGESRSEKFTNIGKIVKSICDRENNDNFLSVVVNDYKVPDVLVPLIKVLVGVKIKNPEFIIEALKSDDIYLINEALRARWFYDGSNHEITNYEYFSKKLLPFVSMKTRREIVKRLTVCLVGGDRCVKIAQEFFNGLVQDYRLNEVTSLLSACDKEFIYEAIIKHKIVFNNKQLIILYRKYPDLALRYLKFTNPYESRDEISKMMFRLINVNDYEKFLPLLVTNNPEFFVTMQEISHASCNLSNRRAKIFLKKTKHLLINRPRDIIELMPVKLIHNSLKLEEFETMFGNILEDRWDMFCLDEMMNYLAYYPEEKKAILLRNKVKEKYGYDLYDKVEKITTEFLLLLPKEERFVLARRIVEVRHKMESSDPDISWWCFLPTKEAIHALKVQILKNWKSDKRQKFFSQLIYVCKLNDSKEALLEVLRFVDQYYQKEKSDVLCGMLDKITQEFDVEEFDNNYWTCIFDIIKRIRLKKENARDYWVLIKILKKHVHYCVDNNQPIDEIIDLMIKLFLEGRVGVSWKLLEDDDPSFERLYLDACFKNNYWLNMDYKKNAFDGIYNFNDRHVTNNDKNQGLRLSINDYPRLLEIVEKTLKNKKNEEISWIVYTKKILKKHEPKLYDAWFSNDDDKNNNDESPTSSINSIEDYRHHQLLPSPPASPSPTLQEQLKSKIIYITEGIIALKRNYNEIKENWLGYYECCKEQESVSKKRHYVRHFLKSLIWYQDVPVKFVEKAMNDQNYVVLGHLLDGRTFSKIASTLLPNESKDQYDCYMNALRLSTSLKNTTTPITTDLVLDFLNANYMYSFKNYINDGLKLWSFVAYRTNLSLMIDLSKNLFRGDRLFLKRHAVRLMNFMASRYDLVEFYTIIWQNEQHRMIRELLLEKIGNLFSERPNDDTWLLMKRCLDEMTISEEDDLESLIGYKPVPVNFASVYIKSVLDMLRRLNDQGASRQQAAKLLDQLLDNIKPECQAYVTEDVCRDVLRYFYENRDTEFANVDRFVVKIYLNSSNTNFQNRLNYFVELLRIESLRWYDHNLERRKNLPNLVDNFVHALVYQVQKFKGSHELVKNLAREFERLFPAHRHAYAHVMLFLCKLYTKNPYSFKKFGISISECIHELVERYAPEYFMQIVEMIREFVCNFNFYEYTVTLKNRLNFLEGLTRGQKNNDRYGYIIAAKLLNQKIVCDFNHQHCAILQRLSESNDPVVQSFL